MICGSARTAPHNRVFLDGIKYALMADPAWRDGYFAEPPVRGLRAMGRIYAGWALSQAFYREELWRTIGFSSPAGIAAAIGLVDSSMSRPPHGGRWLALPTAK